MAEVVDIGGVEVEIPDVEPERRVRTADAYTPEECIQLAHVWKRETGAPPTRNDWNPAKRRRNILNMLDRLRDHRDAAKRYTTGGYPGVNTILNRFGSWDAFIAACGWEPRGRGRPQIFTSAKPATPTREQLRRRVGEDNEARPRAWGRAALASLVRRVLEVEASGDAEALTGVLLDGAAELLAWADHIQAQEAQRAA